MKTHIISNPDWSSAHGYFANDIPKGYWISSLAARVLFSRGCSSKFEHFGPVRFLDPRPGTTLSTKDYLEEVRDEFDTHGLDRVSSLSGVSESATEMLGDIALWGKEDDTTVKLLAAYYRKCSRDALSTPVSVLPEYFSAIGEIQPERGWTLKSRTVTLECKNDLGKVKTIEIVFKTVRAPLKYVC